MSSRCVYDTLTCSSARSIVYKSLSEFIGTNKVGGGKLFQVTPGIVAISPDVQNFRLFVHPATLQDNPISYIDPRPYFKPNGDIRVAREYKALLLRAAMDYEYNNDRQSMEYIAAPTAAIFAQWMVNTLSSHYALEQVDKERIRIIMGVYYYLLFTPNAARAGRASDDMQLRIERFVLGSLRQSRQFYEDVIETFDQGDIASACYDLSSAVISMVRLIDSPAFKMTHTTLITIAINGWTQREVELCGSALEHVPSLVYMITTALEVSAFNKTKVGQAVQSAQRMKVDPTGIVRWARDVADTHDVAGNSTKNFNVL